MEKKQYLIGVVSLGCDKNRVDTENMMTYLNKRNEFSFTADPKDADVIIINTCAFIKSARDESQDTINEMINYKKKGNCKCLVVTGCYPQKYLTELTEQFPEVDVFLGTNEYENIADHILGYINSENKEQITKNDTPHYTTCIEEGRLITTPSYYAYLRIADGCDNFCSYCTIPYIRGRFRSRKMESILTEAESLVKAGAKELIVVAQDTAKYGVDIYGESKLHELINRLSKIKKLEWIRLLYCYPENITDALIEEIKENKKVCKYIDVPFQHVSNNILKAMNRKTDYDSIVKITEKLQSIAPNFALRSTFIIGFPGETKEDHEKLLNFLQTYKLPNVGFFAYSREDGTVAARFDGQVDDGLKQKRLLKAVKVQKKIVQEYNKNLVGKNLKVILEGFDERKCLYVGRSEYEAPDIDTITYFSSNRELSLGEMVDVTIVKVKGYDLYGIEEETKGEN